MAIGTIISAGLAIAGFASSMAGASQSKAANRKAIEQQYKLDKQNWKFAQENNEDVYNYEQDSVNIARQNNENELKFREANDLAAYKRQLEERQRDFKQQTKAFKKSNKEYNDQVKLNQNIANLAVSDSQTKYNEQLKELGFQQQRNQLNYLQTQDSINQTLKRGQNTLKDAATKFRLDSQQASFAKDQALRSAQTSIDYAKDRQSLARERTGIGKDALNVERDIERTNRDRSISELRDARSSNQLQTQQEIDSVKAKFQDQRLASEQERGGIRANLEKQNLAISQKEEDIISRFEDQKLGANQNIGELSDNTKYQLFDSESKIENLKGELVTSGLKYQQERATKMFQLQAQNITNLQAQGQAAASGQKGRSAALNVASAMAASGRANAQLTDSILRGDRAQENTVTNIKRRIGQLDTLKGMQKATGQRKTGDVRETLGRGKENRDRLVAQQKSLKSFAKSDANRQIQDSKDTLSNQKDTSKRLIGDARETNKQKNAEIKNKIGFERRQFNDSMNKLSVEKRELMANLDAQLSQYGFDIKRSRNQQLAARQNFRASQNGINAALKSARQDYNLTRSEAKADMKRANMEQKIQQKETQQSLKSAAKALKSSVRKIGLDQYSANLTAASNRMVKPIPAPNPPKPMTYPRTVYQDPRKAPTPPPPIKGVAQGGQMMSAVGSGLSSLAGINWSGISNASSGGGSGGL